MYLVTELVSMFALVAFCAVSQAAPGDEAVKACAEALRIAAKKEYKREDDKALDTMVSDTFCQVVKDKPEGSQRPMERSGPKPFHSA